MNVPKLRFKEFTDEYSAYKLKEKCEIYDGTHETPKYTSNGVSFVSVEDIKNLFGSNKYISREDFEKYKIKPKINDIFMTRIGDIGTSAILNKEIPLAYYVSLSLIRCKNKTLNASYLNQYISCYRFQKELNNRTIHVAFPKKINTREIGESNIVIPNDVKEQTKIANFLSLLDKKIDLQAKEIEALKLYKKGLSNKLLKKENSVNCLLSDIASFENGKGHESIIDNYGEYILINSKFISTDGTVIKRCSKQLTPLYKNDIAMVMSDLPNGKALAKCYYIEENSLFSLNQRICKIKITNENKYNSRYLFYILNRNPYFLKFDDGVNQTNLKKEDILNIPLFIPDIKYQKKVSSILLLIDKKINLEIEKQNKLNNLKKGLMQKMFV